MDAFRGRFVELMGNQQEQASSQRAKYLHCDVFARGNNNTTRFRLVRSQVADSVMAEVLKERRNRHRNRFLRSFGYYFPSDGGVCLWTDCFCGLHKRPSTKDGKKERNKKASWAGQVVAADQVCGGRGICLSPYHMPSGRDIERTRRGPAE
jgi:hypothetical protein